MKETLLLKIALICSLIGLIALFFISTKIEFKEYRPNKLSNNVGDDVKLQGIITKINDKGNVVFVELKQENFVNVVMFSEDNSSLKKGDNVEIIGKVQDFNGKNEIIAQKVRVIK